MAKWSTHIRNKWRLALFILQAIPINAFKPGVCSNISDTLAIGFASQALFRIAFNELNEILATVFGNRDYTYPSESRDACITTPWSSAVREPKGILEDTLSHLFRIPSIKGPLVEKKLVCCDAQTPPVNLPRIAFSPNNLRSHVGHTTCNTCVWATFWVVNSNVKVCEMGVAHCIQENIIWLQVTDDRGFSKGTKPLLKNIPVNYPLAV